MNHFEHPTPTPAQTCVEDFLSDSKSKHLENKDGGPQNSGHYCCVVSVSGKLWQWLLNWGSKPKEGKDTFISVLSPCQCHLEMHHTHRGRRLMLQKQEFERKLND